MINLNIETKLSPSEAAKKVKSYFSEGGLGLELEEESQECLNFTGGGGYVNAVICPSGDKTSIELVSQEWEIQVRKFAETMS